MRGEPHHHRLGHDQAFGGVEVGAHAGGIDLQAVENETGVVQRRATREREQATRRVGVVLASITRIEPLPTSMARLGGSGRPGDGYGIN